MKYVLHANIPLATHERISYIIFVASECSFSFGMLEQMTQSAKNGPDSIFFCSRCIFDPQSNLDATFSPRKFVELTGKVVRITDSSLAPLSMNVLEPLRSPIFLLLSSPTHLNLLNHLPSLENEQKRRHPGSLESFSDKKGGRMRMNFAIFPLFRAHAYRSKPEQFVPITIIESLRVSCDNKPSIIR